MSSANQSNIQKLTEKSKITEQRGKNTPPPWKKMIQLFAPEPEPGAK
jgi:hypothetical protein